MENTAKSNYIVRRLIVYIVGVFIVAVATRLSIVANLGVACGTALAKALEHLAQPVIDLGFFYMDAVSVWMFIVAIIVCLAQILILGKEFKPVSLLQLVFAFIFSICISYAAPLVAWCKTDVLWIRYVELIISVIVTGLGITVVVSAKLVQMPPESLALAIIQKFKKEYLTLGRLRMAYDITCAVLAIIFSWILIGKPLMYVREGTVLAAFVPGLFVDIFMKIIGKPLAIFCFGKEGYVAQLRSFGVKVKDEAETSEAE